MINNTEKKKNIKLFQIFYDDITKKKIDNKCIPLDNSKNIYRDWYEFWPILNFINTNELVNETWYGFFSTKFEDKTGKQFEFIQKVLEKNNNIADVAIFSSGWDQICYFQNVFEQGEFWHKGIINETENFLKRINYDINLLDMVGDFQTSVFSNYLVAKKNFWIEWKNIASLFFEYCNLSNASKANSLTTYSNSLAPMKAFIQERLPSLVLTKNKYNVLALDETENGPIYTRLFEDNIEVRRHLKNCELMKREYNKTKDIIYLNEYRKIRKKIILKKI